MNAELNHSNQRIFSVATLQAALLSLRATLYPPRCQSCSKPTLNARAFCCDCEQKIEFIHNPCNRCGAPLHATQVQSKKRQKCMHCRKGDWPSDQVFCVCTYEGVVKQSVIRMKQPGSEVLGVYFGKLLADFSREQIEWGKIDAILTVPQHWKKRIRVRHNSSEVLSEQVAKHLKVKLYRSGLRRLREATKQGLLARRDRASNITGAYGISPRFDVAGKSFVVVDDIVTTGATAAAISRPLKEAGAAHIYFLAVARGVNASQKSVVKPRLSPGNAIV